jgi:hypothetical protein
MNSDVQTVLAFILFLPWFTILGALYWLFPRQPRSAARRVVDSIVLVFAAVLSVVGTAYAHRYADPGAGAIWKQVLATLVGYGIFLAVLAIAMPLRQWWLRR